MLRYRRTSFLFAVLAVLIFFLGQTLCFAQKDGDDIVIGKYRVIHSQILDEDRLLFVHLPRDYEDTRLSYPVLYLLYVDVYNYFADAARITERLGPTGEMPPLIIIGVANTKRYRDLLPIKTRDRSEGGGSDNFLRFLEEELVPHVDRTYRTKNFLYIKCEKDERPQDLEYAQKLVRLLESKKPEGFRFRVEFREPSGDFIAAMPFREGLKMLFPGHKLPDNFQTNGLKDIIDYYKQRSEEYGFEVDPPSLMLIFEGDKLNQQGKAREALAVFDFELRQNPKSLNALWRLGETYRGMGEFEKARDNYKRSLEIRDVDVAMVHMRLNQVEKMLERSAAYRIEQALKKNGIEAGTKMFREIRSDPESNLYFEENEFNALGYRLMGAGKIKDAIEIFKLNVELYPASANGYDSLAEAYMNSGDSENAVRNYKKSLELNPENSNAKEMLKKLEER
jgi:tetratricopeptide (TPR) repeat protein